MDIVEKDEQESRKRKHCDSCEENEILSTHCKSCSISLCKKCTHAHNKFKDCSHDDLLSFELFEAQNKLDQTILQVQRSKKHINMLSSGLVESRESIKADIQKCVDYIKDILEQNKTKLMDECDSKFDEKTALLKSFHIEANSLCKRLVSLNTKKEKSMKPQEDRVTKIETEINKSEDLCRQVNNLSLEVSFNKMLRETDYQIGTLSTINDRSEGTFKFIIENLSQMKGNILSPPHTVRNLPWKIMARLQYQKGVNDFGFYVQCNANDISTSWSCHASVEYRLHKWDCEEEPDKRKTQHIFCHKEDDWGFHSFLPWKDIVDPLKGYIKDDKITLEVVIKADEPKGVDKSK